jgi:hypothetical protein
VDSLGARLLVDRIRAGVTVGRVIKVERDAPELDLCVGDAGTIRDITPEGWLVAWEKGTTFVVDPAAVGARVMS